MAKNLYIGKSVYTRKKFVDEANNIGVSRAIMWTMLQKLKFGQIVYTSFWTSNKTINNKEDRNDENKLPIFSDQEGRRHIKIGRAETFGFFQLSGLNMDSLTSDLLLEQLRKMGKDAKEVRSSGSEGVPPDMKRACGSMKIGSCIILDPTTTLQEIYEALVQIKEDLKNDPDLKTHKIKTFLTGSFYEFEKDQVFDNVSFSRSLSELNLPERFKEVEELTINVIKEYSQNKYNKKT
jgi:hypothetical protein